MTHSSFFLIVSIHILNVPNAELLIIVFFINILLIFYYLSKEDI
jgi:hypothetical protein